MAVRVFIEIERDHADEFSITVDDAKASMVMPVVLKAVATVAAHYQNEIDVPVRVRAALWDFLESLKKDSADAP